MERRRNCAKSRQPDNDCPTHLPPDQPTDEWTNRRRPIQTAFKYISKAQRHLLAEKEEERDRDTERHTYIHRATERDIERDRVGNQECRQVTQKVRQWNAKVEGEILIQFNILFKADRKRKTRAEQREKGIGCFVCVSVLHVS